MKLKIFILRIFIALTLTSLLYKETGMLQSSALLWSHFTDVQVILNRWGTLPTQHALEMMSSKTGLRKLHSKRSLVAHMLILRIMIAQSTTSWTTSGSLWTPQGLSSTLPLWRKCTWTSTTTTSAYLIERMNNTSIRDPAVSTSHLTSTMAPAPTATWRSASGRTKNTIYTRERSIQCLGSCRMSAGSITHYSLLGSSYILTSKDPYISLL